MVRNGLRGKELHAGFVDMALRDATKSQDCGHPVWGVGLKACRSLPDSRDGSVKRIAAASLCYLTVRICGDAAICCVGHQEHTLDDDSLMPPFPTIFSPG